MVWQIIPIFTTVRSRAWVVLAARRVFRVAQWTPCAPNADQEIADRGFFALGALPEGTTNGARRRLAELFLGAEASLHW